MKLKQKKLYRRMLLGGVNRINEGDYSVSQQLYDATPKVVPNTTGLDTGALQETINDSSRGAREDIANRKYGDVGSGKLPDITYTREGFNNALKGILGKNEGTYVHYNKGEKSVTLPYGMYIAKNKNAKSALMFKEMAKRYGISNLSSAKKAKAFNKVASDEDKKALANQALEDIGTSIADDNLLAHLEPKTALAYADVATNQGKYHPSKTIQKELGTTADGILGSGALNSLAKQKSQKDIAYAIYLNALNRSKELVRKNKKNARFAKGWEDRFKRGLNMVSKEDI